MLTMGQRVNLLGLVLVPVDPAQTRQRVDAVNVHRARAADALAAGPTERQCRVEVVLDLDQGVQDHGPAFGKVDLVGLKLGLFRGLVGVLQRLSAGGKEERMEDGRTHR
jgi:hypothetical protein